jgi:tetratricopeptide (TPR) repeat protein
MTGKTRSPLEVRAWQRIRRYLEADQQMAARIALESLVQRAPDDVEARVLLAGAILSGDKRVRAATDQLRAAANALPEDADLVAMVALAMLRVGEVTGARKCLENPAVEKTTSYENLMSLAHVHQLLGEHKKSLAFMDRAKAQGYDNADFRYFRGVQLQFNGRLDEAEMEMERCLQMGPTFGRASLTLARLKRQTPQSNHLAYLREQLRRVENGTEDHASFEFALYKELEDLGDYENAWSALERGNAIMHGRLRHQPDEERSLFDSLISATEELPRRAATESSGPQPIFVVGLPRSGTTLLERILGNHSMIRSAGELSDFPRQMQWQANHFSFPILDSELVERAGELDYAGIAKRYLEQSQWRAEGKPFYTDKLPPNFMLAGFIRCAFPDAPILHMVRDPMDVCFSNYRAMFGESYPYSYDMQSLISHYLCYRRLMKHWHNVMPGEILDISYNALVRNPESTVQEILAFCRLPYESGCFDLTRNSTPVATMSSAQTRKEINDRSIGQWRQYENQLRSLKSRVEN